MKALAERIADADAHGRRATGAADQRRAAVRQLSLRRRQWETADESATAVADRLPLAADGGGDARRPYFETLFVTPAPAASLRQIAQEIGRLRRAGDAMIYEPVLVGSFEDALLAIILNGKIEAVVIYDGIPIPSKHDVAAAARVPRHPRAHWTPRAWRRATSESRWRGPSSACARNSTSTC